MWADPERVRVFLSLTSRSPLLGLCEKKGRVGASGSFFPSAEPPFEFWREFWLSFSCRCGSGELSSFGWCKSSDFRGNKLKGVFMREDVNYFSIVKREMLVRGFWFLGETNRGKVLHFCKPICEDTSSLMSLSEIPVYRCAVRENEDMTKNFKFEYTTKDGLCLSSQWGVWSFLDDLDFENMEKTFLNTIQKIN